MSPPVWQLAVSSYASRFSFASAVSRLSRDRHPCPPPLVRRQDSPICGLVFVADQRATCTSHRECEHHEDGVTVLPICASPSRPSPVRSRMLSCFALLNVCVALRHTAVTKPYIAYAPHSHHCSQSRQNCHRLRASDQISRAFAPGPRRWSGSGRR